MTSDSRISILQGGGGESMQRLLKESVLKYIMIDGGEVGLTRLDDSAVVDDIAFTIDGHTVKPLIYPGGDIGRLAVSGTVNDLAAMGAEPIALASSLVLEEGLETSILERVMKSMFHTSQEVKTAIVTGDTKVVEKGSVDGMVVTTAGIGRAGESMIHNRSVCAENGRSIRWLEDRNPRDGDMLIVSGTIGDHGIALMSFREGYGFETKLKSDTAPLSGMMNEALRQGGITSAKDPTRGGMANALNEWATKSNTGIRIEETKLPFKEEVIGASEMLGIEPLNVGNEGKMLLAVMPDMADAVLKALHSHKYGRDAAIIGRMESGIKGVVMQTRIGGRRIVEPPTGDPVPRIC